MQKESELIYSPLQQTYSTGGKSVDIKIYRLPETGWTVEVVDEHGNSTVWKDEFATDQDAFDIVMKTIREEGIGPRMVRPSDWISWIRDLQDGENAPEFKG